MNAIFCPIITAKDIGGGIKSTISLLNSLSRLGHAVTILVPKNCAFLEKFDKNIQILYFKKQPNISIFKFWSFLQLCSFTKNVYKKVNKAQPTLYFCSDRPALMLAFLLSKQTPLFYISRGWFYTNVSAKFLRLVMFPRVHQFVGISDKQFHLMKQYAPKDAYVNLIQNGINLPVNTFKPFTTNSIKLATIGGICDRKNQMLCLQLLKVLKQDFDVHLNIFGTTFTPTDEAYKQTLETYIEQNQLQKRVTFMGNVPDFDAIYSQSDIVLSTAKEEGFGRTIIEAMSYGIPVIASDKAGGPSTIITHEVNGILYDGFLEDLKQKVVCLINNEPLRNTIIENALGHVKKNYTMERVANDYSQLIENHF